MRTRMVFRGLETPDSQAAMVRWVVPSFSASICWVQPCFARKMMISCAIS